MKLMNRVGALRATNNQGLQPAIDFILEHNDEAIPVAATSNPISDKDVLISMFSDRDRVDCTFSKQ